MRFVKRDRLLAGRAGIIRGLKMSTPSPLTPIEQAAIPSAVALNLAMGFVVNQLGLPIYLDTLGTVLTAALAVGDQGALEGGVIEVAVLEVPVSGVGEARRTEIESLVGVANEHRASLRVGDPSDNATQMGPVASAAQCTRILGMIDAARTAGDGELLAGGDRLDGDLAEGFYIAPTVFGEVDNASALAQQEVFGPVLSVLRSGDDDEAVALARLIGRRPDAEAVFRAAGRYLANEAAGLKSRCEGERGGQQHALVSPSRACATAAALQFASPTGSRLSTSAARRSAAGRHDLRGATQRRLRRRSAPSSRRARQLDDRRVVTLR